MGGQSDSAVCVCVSSLSDAYVQKLKCIIYLVMIMNYEIPANYREALGLGIPFLHYHDKRIHNPEVVSVLR